MLVRTRRISICTVALLVSALASDVSAKIDMTSIFSDGAVFQQNIKVPVWGWAEAGAGVTVSFGLQSKSTRADETGKWMIHLDPMEASSDGREMIVTSGEDSLTIRDILVGEVWLCSGQSNMGWGLVTKVNPKFPELIEVYKYMQKEVAETRDPLLRQFISPSHAQALERRETFQGNGFKVGAWGKCDPQYAAFTAVGYFFAKELRKEVGVPVGIIKCAWGGSRVESWIPKEEFEKTWNLKEYYAANLKQLETDMAAWDQAAEDAKRLQRIKDWKERNPGKTPTYHIVKHIRPPDANHNFPTALYNGMIHPLVPYAIRGVVWYQGEPNNGHCPDEYLERFSILIHSWRRIWGQGDLPFYYAQLANYHKTPETPQENVGWCTVQNSQRLALSIKNTGMAVINDTGEAHNIHPANKLDVGKRLALWALAKDHGRDGIVYSGPLYKKSMFTGQNVRITFDHVADGLMVAEKELFDPAKKVDAPLRGFQICGKDRQWEWAEAKIVDKDVVEVWHPKLQDPVEVRYAWASNPIANLYNSEGLPTSVFKCERK
jgi:sialate O-acetylesterase